MASDPPSQSQKGSFPRTVQRFRKLSKDVSTSLMFRMFIKEKHKKVAADLNKISSEGKGFDYYSRHQSIFDYSEPTKIETKVDPKKIQRNYSIDLTTVRQLNKIVFNSTQYTKHCESIDSQSYPYKS